MLTFLVMKVVIFIVTFCSLLLVFPVKPLLAQVADPRLFIPPKVKNLENSKILLKQIYSKIKKPTTLYCECKINSQPQNTSLDCKNSKANEISENNPIIWGPVYPIFREKESIPYSDFSLAESDLHNIFPQLKNHTYCSNVAAFSLSENTRQEIRGEIARAWFYISFQYEISIPDDIEDKLRKWHLSDPPSPMEEERNSLIEDAQGNRNPFIDHPALVERVPNF